MSVLAKQDFPGQHVIYFHRPAARNRCIGFPLNAGAREAEYGSFGARPVHGIETQTAEVEQLGAQPVEDRRVDGDDDRTGSYQLMLVCFAFALALASLPMLRLGPYAYPAPCETGQENARATAH